MTQSEVDRQMREREAAGLVTWDKHRGGWVETRLAAELRRAR
jgi:hypothetical protein